MRQREEEKKNLSPYQNFGSADGFELAEWFMEAEVSQSDKTRLLKTRMAKRAKVKWPNSQAFLADVDKLPKSTPWIHKLIQVIHPNHPEMLEEVDIYYRDPMALIKELLGNPNFNHPDMIFYEPVKVYVGMEGCDDSELEREYTEANTGKWWNTVQGKVPDGATVVPAIISSDKTQLSMFGGDKAAWPIYLTIGNIAKGIRRQPSKHATVLLRYLNATKLEFVQNELVQRLALRNLFHNSMRHILGTLKEAGQTGMMLTCADGMIRNVFPFLSAYVCDHPEQCLIAYTKQSHCHICMVPHNECGDLTEYPYRKRSETVNAIRAKAAKERSKDSVNFDKLGLYPVEPFWGGFRFIDEDTIFTPDILHQLHKGVFQTHLLSWASKIMTDEEIDRRFQAIPAFSGLRHFYKGISHISQMTGKEQKELEKLLMVIIASDPSFPEEATIAASALLNFIYLARFPQHTDHKLKLMEESLKTFHAHKDIFVDEIYQADVWAKKKSPQTIDFNAIPKLHGMQHYIESIRQKGTADGYSMESPERLHIDFAKKAYRATNKKEYIEQMIIWMERQEAIIYMQSYLNWRDRYRSSLYSDSEDEEDDKGETDTFDLNCALQALAVQEGDESRANHHHRTAPGSSEAALLAVSPYTGIPFMLESRNPLSLEQVPHTLNRNPDFRGQSFQDIEGRHQIKDFHFYFFQYMVSACPEVNQAFDEGSPYHRIVAKPAHSRRTHLHINDVPSHYDTVFVLWDGSSNETTPQARGIHNYRIGQIRAIFKLAASSELYRWHPQPLAYVEYFKSIPSSPNKDTGLATVKRAWVQQARHAAIVPLTHIHFPCHLVPSFGASVSESWISIREREDPLESDNLTFFLNPFVTLLTYSLVYRLGFRTLAEGSAQALRSQTDERPKTTQEMCRGLGVDDPNVNEDMQSGASQGKKRRRAGEAVRGDDRLISTRMTLRKRARVES